MMGVVQVHKSDSQFTFCTEKRKQELYKCFTHSIYHNKSHIMITPFLNENGNKSECMQEIEEEEDRLSTNLYC